MCFLFLFFISIILSQAALAADSDGYASDNGVKIKRLFVNESSMVAVEFAEPLVGANKIRSCGSGEAWTKSWAGLSASANDRLVSALFSAQAQGKELKVGTRGCVGNWHQIVNIYINQ